MIKAINLEPKNKYAWIEPIGSADKVGGGLLYAPGNVTNQYRLAKLCAFDKDCPEAEGYEVGQTVLYDTLGAVEHTLGPHKVWTVKIMNIVAVVHHQEAA